MANSNLTRIFTTMSKLVNSFVNFLEKAFMNLPPMVQIPLFPDLALTSEKSEVNEWVYVGQDSRGRAVFENYNNPDEFKVEEQVYSRVK